MSEVLEVVKDLPNRKSSGLDGLNRIESIGS